MKLRTQLSLCALVFSSATTGNALSIDINYIGNISYSDGTSCSVDLDPYNGDRLKRSLNVRLFWPGPRFWLDVRATTPVESAAAPSNTLDNPALTRHVCTAVIKAYRARLARQSPANVTPLTGSRYRPNDAFLSPDSIVLGAMTCAIAFPKEPSDGKTPALFEINFGRDEVYTGIANLPQMSWRPTAMPTERRALAVRACNGIAADLAQRIGKLQ